MKLSTFSCLVPLLVAQIVAGGKPTSALVTPNEVHSQSMATRINGGAMVRRQSSPTSIYPPSQHQTPTNDPLTQRRVAFLPLEADQAVVNQEVAPTSIWGKLKASLGNKDGLSLKERLAKKGFAAFLTFTLLSNITSMSCLSFAWYGFSVQTGMSPLFPGQWKPFLPVLAGSMAVDASLKPLRLVLSIAAAPMSDRAMNWLKRKCNGSKRAAFAIVFAGIIGSAFGLLAAGVGLASSISGVPVFAP